MDKRILAIVWMKLLLVELVAGYYLFTLLFVVSEDVRIGIAVLWGGTALAQFGMAVRLMYFGWAEKVKDF